MDSGTRPNLSIKFCKVPPVGNEILNIYQQRAMGSLKRLRKRCEKPSVLIGLPGFMDRYKMIVGKPRPHHTCLLCLMKPALWPAMCLRQPPPQALFWPTLCLRETTLWPIVCLKARPHYGHAGIGPRWPLRALGTVGAHTMSQAPPYCGPHNASSTALVWPTLCLEYPPPVPHALL